MSDDLESVIRDLGKVAALAVPDVDRVMKKGAQNIKDSLVDEARSSPTLGARLARSISYDAVGKAGQLAYEIGPDKDRFGGPLGNIYYFGTSRGGGTGDLDGPLDREEPNLVSEMEKAVDRWGDVLERS